jgi:hypothetical protein
MYKKFQCYITLYTFDNFIQNKNNYLSNKENWVSWITLMDYFY